MEENKARVINKLMDKFIIEDTTNQEIFEAKLRGNVKVLKRTVLVGDLVIYEKSYDCYMITKLLERKNSLIRPPVANIDNLIITMSLIDPKPDYNLLDKELILSLANDINPVICINKVDIRNEKTENEIAYINKVYSKICKDIIFVSAKENINIDELKNKMNSKISAFSGNSGVGKSSIVTKIIGEMKNLEIGDIGVKSKKGRHTTKHVELYKYDKNTYIVDTPGFSSYEIYNIESSDLKKYYSEFTNFECDFDDCCHVKEAENVCAVKRALRDGLIDRSRYERYVYIYNKLKEEEKREYK